MIPLIRTATPQDAAALSALITTTLRTSNVQDYPPEIIARVVESFSPTALSALIARRHVHVAETNNILVATASLDGDWLRSVFVSPDWQGRGIGQAIVNDIESLARTQAIATLWVPSSLTALGFYRRLGYVEDREEWHAGERSVVFRKHLPTVRHP